jgi:hypothetical protein
MHEYDFISRSIREPQVRQIISDAGYRPVDYAYTPRVDNDGDPVKGENPMSLTTLRNSANQLHINVEIT